jgi:hypothetical protein
MDEQQKQLVAKLKDAQNVLVTVSKNPSVDQLSAAIGLTLALNKLDKHATAVYSGQTPSTLEFLKPEDTLEANTDSLRDFIIALDKSKADKLRYKVEDQVVRIFITPYKTSISQDDLEFSQGDFNVDVVVALGVREQSDLDEAIQAHGRILHDAVVSVVSIDGQSDLGSMNVVATGVSSLSEVVTDIVESLDKSVVDAQIATALLTGIVATTDRFSNDRTTPETMTVSARLMSAGANQQLIVSELATTNDLVVPARSESDGGGDAPATPPAEPGTLEIQHDSSGAVRAEEQSEPDEEDIPIEPKAEEPDEDIHVDDDGKLTTAAMLPPVDTSDTEADQPIPHVDTSEYHPAHERIIQPPSREGMLTANTEEEGLDVSTEELTRPGADMPMLSHNAPAEVPSPVDPVQPLSFDQKAPQPEVPTNDAVFPGSESDVAVPSLEQSRQDAVIDTAHETLSEIEKEVGSSHLTAQAAIPAAPTVVGDAPGGVDAARNAVEAALNAASASTPDPIVALNAQPLGDVLHQPEETTPAPIFQPAPGFDQGPASVQPEQDVQPGMTLDMPLPASTPAPNRISAFPGVAPSSPSDNTLPPPPPVPPPMVPPM